MTLTGVDLWAPVKVWVGWCLLANFLGSDPDSSMQHATDLHAALHTMCQILSPASYSDFRARIQELFGSWRSSWSLGSLGLLRGDPAVTAGVDPAQAWARYHDDRTRLTRVQVAEAWSGLYPQQSPVAGCWQTSTSPRSHTQGCLVGLEGLACRAV